MLKRRKKISPPVKSCRFARWRCLDSVRRRRDQHWWEERSGRSQSCDSGRGRDLRGALEHEPWRRPDRDQNQQQDPEPKNKKTNKTRQLFQSSWVPLTPPTGDAWEVSLSLSVSSKTADGPSVGGAWSFQTASFCKATVLRGEAANLQETQTAAGCTSSLKTLFQLCHK